MWQRILTIWKRQTHVRFNLIPSQPNCSQTGHTLLQKFKQSLPGPAQLSNISERYYLALLSSRPIPMVTWTDCYFGMNYKCEMFCSPQEASPYHSLYANRLHSLYKWGLKIHRPSVNRWKGGMGWGGNHSPFQMWPCAKLGRTRAAIQGGGMEGGLWGRSSDCMGSHWAERSRFVMCTWQWRRGHDVIERLAFGGDVATQEGLRVS